MLLRIWLFLELVELHVENKLI